MPLKIIMPNRSILLLRVYVGDEDLLPVNVAPHDELPSTELYLCIWLATVIHNTRGKIHSNTQGLPTRCQSYQLKIIDHHPAIQPHKLCKARHHVHQDILQV